MFSIPRLAGLLVAAALVATRAAGAGPADRLDVGPFQVRAEPWRISAGGFPNTTANPFRKTEVTAFELRYRGVPVGVPASDPAAPPVTRHAHLLHLVDAPGPAFLLATQGFHRVDERDGRLHVEALGEATTDLAELQWLDAEHGQPAAPRRLVLGRQSVADIALRDGRWLLLGTRTVLDVATLRAYPVRPWIASGSGRAMAGLSAAGAPARFFSPDRGRYVAYASDTDLAAGDGRTYPALLVVEIASGEAEALRIDPRRLRVIDGDDVTADWFAHHFEWRRGDDGPDRLHERAGASPWPRLSRSIEAGGLPAYRWRPATPRLAARLRALLDDRFGARPLPRDASSHAGEDALSLSGCAAGIALRPPAAGDRTATFVLEARRSAADPAPCAARLAQVAAAFDAELIAGTAEELFGDEARAFAPD